ncbi:conserved hypothetical protein [Ricinus communis]|uniref:RNase H type-1 domain-containing protein n=1 Tax=Ricinus communis TaxID=3988 RepID=B9SMZ1_RICCO|nr:conserved hypothetical protein [Ricinus communis]
MEGHVALVQLMVWIAGFSRICVELDSKAITDSLSQEIGDDPSCCILILAICKLISRPWQIRLRHVFREANQCVDWLAGQAYGKAWYQSQG